MRFPVFNINRWQTRIGAHVTNAGKGRCRGQPRSQEIPVFAVNGPAIMREFMGQLQTPGEILKTESSHRSSSK
jgi:hypothetical protein